MRKKIERVYLGYLIFILLAFVYSLLIFRLRPQGRGLTDGYCELTLHKETPQKDNYSTIGYREIYSLTTEGIQGAYSHLVFLSIHQEVKVYVGNVCIYSMRDSSKNKFGRTPGCVWNDILLSSDYEGQEIRIEIIPVYKSSAGMVPRCYFGTKYGIVRMILTEEGPEFVMGLAAIILGLVYMVYVLFNASNSEVDRGIAWLGCFALMVGLWKMADNSLIKLLLPGLPAVSLLPFIALMLGVIPLILFIKKFYSARKQFFWYIYCWMSIAEMSICIILQYFDLKDFRETFVLTVAVILCGFGLFAGMFISEVRGTGWNERLLRNSFSVLICFMGIGLDFWAYFISGGTRTTIVGMLIFMIYGVSQGYAALNEARELAVVGMRASNYEKMAYHDQLTGLFNRSALAEDTEALGVAPDKAIVIIFDLNDLKKCNDNLGHDKGDIYIRESARLIQTIFEQLGRCYRTGGDEFCCLVLRHSLDSCKKQIELLRQKVAEYNKGSKDIHMAIACGCAMYDKRIDYDINDTAKRADQIMYEDKERLKKEAAGNKSNG